MKTPIILLCIVLLFTVTSCCDRPTEVMHDEVANPVFSPESYMYNPGLQVTLSCTTPNAEIRYTTNGYYEHNSSHEYTGPITVDSTMTIKAVAYYRTNHSEIVTATYAIYQDSFYDNQDISQMTASPDTIFADNGVTFSQIRVKVVNVENFGVPEQRVEFHTDLGHIIESAVTDSAGFARANFTADNESGIARITAITKKYHPEYPEFVISADTAYVDVTIQSPTTEPQIVHSLQFVQTGQIDLNVANTGGVEAVYLRVKQYDEDGILFTEPRNIWFKIMNEDPPIGVNLNGQSPADSVMAVSSNGIAQVILYSGIQSGTLVIRASCTDAGLYVTTASGDIVIHAGPPHRIEPFASGYNTGEDMGSGLWRILAGARCYDLYDNPVEYGTSVWFQIPDNSYNCQIGANAYVGNESVYGDSTAGVAYTWITYYGWYTFEHITLTAITGGYNGQEVFGEADIILPLNQPDMELYIIPGNMVFHGNTPNTTPSFAMADVYAYVSDGQGCFIRYALVSMTTNYPYGIFEYTQGTNVDPEHYNPIEANNIITTDPNGEASGLIRFYPEGIPYADAMAGGVGVRSVTIIGTLVGTDVTAQTTTTLIRYSS
jgi:hypothetical protein